MMKTKTALVALVSLGLVVSCASCATSSEAQDYGDPTQRNAPTTEDGIVAYVVSPTASDHLASASVDLVVAAYTSSSEALTVVAGTHESGETTATVQGSPGPAARYHVTVPLLHGANVVGIGIQNADGSKFRRLSYIVLYDGTSPAIAFQLAVPAMDGTCNGATPLTAAVTNQTNVCALGVVTTASGRVAKSVSLATDKGASVPVMVAKDGSFATVVPLAKDTKIGVTGTVVDDAGGKASATRTLSQTAQGPKLVVTAPAPGKATFTDAPTATLEGTVDDPYGVAALHVDSPGGYSLSVTPTSPWKATVQLQPGMNMLSVVAKNDAGNETSVPVSIVQNRIIHLSAPKLNQGSTKLALDRMAMSSLISDADQKTLIMAEVPLRPAIESTLNAIRDPEKFGVDITTWGAPEQSMNRLLNMTPDVANLKGSSVEELLGIATAVGLPPPRLLGDLLGISVTTTVVDLSIATDVILAQVVGTHPNVDKDSTGAPILRVSMYDVFQDLHTIGPKFGPAGMHPGFLSGDTEAKVLQPGFQMSLPVKSNLTQYEGVDASANERAALFLLQGDQVLELDFTSPDFSIEGLTDEPTMDLRMKVTENPAFLSVGKTKMAGADPANPGFYRGDGAAWNIPLWQIEHVVAEISYRQDAKLYGPSYTKSLSYDAGSIKNAATIGWDHGWVTIQTAGGIGSPPAPQYVWDLLNEVAQIRLHDGGTPEGQANLGFTLKNLPLGLSADELIAKVKPSLQGQSAQLSKLIAGSGGLADSGVDLFYVPRTTGGGYLFFRAAGDSTKPYSYKAPGFFADAALGKKTSSTAAAAGTTDTTHEKIDAAVGTKAFFQDDTGAVYSLEVVASNTDGIDVRVIPAGAP
jgi:hypothetical protein